MYHELRKRGTRESLLTMIARTANGKCAARINETLTKPGSSGHQCLLYYNKLNP